MSPVFKDAAGKRYRIALKSRGNSFPCRCFEKEWNPVENEWLTSEFSFYVFQDEYHYHCEIL